MGELQDLEGSKTTLEQGLEAAKASLEEKKQAFTSAHDAHKEAKAAVKEAESAVAEAKTAQKKGDANHEKMQKEKAAIESAYEEHFKTPMDASEGPHHKHLEPFIESLGLDDSLTKAL